MSGRHLRGRSAPLARRPRAPILHHGYRADRIAP